MEAWVCCAYLNVLSSRVLEHGRRSSYRHHKKELLIVTLVASPGLVESSLTVDPLQGLPQPRSMLRLLQRLIAGVSLLSFQTLTLIVLARDPDNPATACEHVTCALCFQPGSMMSIRYSKRFAKYAVDDQTSQDPQPSCCCTSTMIFLNREAGVQSSTLDTTRTAFSYSASTVFDLLHKSSLRFARDREACSQLMDLEIAMSACFHTFQFRLVSEVHDEM